MKERVSLKAAAQLCLHTDNAPAFLWKICETDPASSLLAFLCSHSLTLSSHLDFRGIKDECGAGADRRLILRQVGCLSPVCRRICRLNVVLLAFTAWEIRNIFSTVFVPHDKINPGSRFQRILGKFSALMKRDEPHSHPIQFSGLFPASALWVCALCEYYFASDAPVLRLCLVLLTGIGLK